MSFKSLVSPRRRAYTRLIGSIANALHSALQDEGNRHGLTKSAIAEKLGKNKSVVTRLFAGTANMTLESLSDLAYAMNRSVRVSLEPKSAPSGFNTILHPTVNVLMPGPQVAASPTPPRKPVVEL